MKLYTNATIKIVENNSFNDQLGNPVDYFTTYLKNDDGQLLEVGSGQNFEAHEGKDGVAVIEAKPREKGGFKLVLKDFVVNGKVDVPEEEVV